jgi:hypothetical protein
MTLAIGLLGAASTLVSAAALVRGSGDRVQTAAAAYAALFVAAGIARTTHPVPRDLVFLLIVFAAAQLAIPTFAAGLEHLLLAGIALAAAAWAALIAPDRVHWLHGFLVVDGWVILVAAVACGVALLLALARPTRRLSWALERVFDAAVLVWLLVVSLHFVV